MLPCFWYNCKVLENIICFIDFGTIMYSELDFWSGHIKKCIDIICEPLKILIMSRCWNTSIYIYIYVKPSVKNEDIWIGFTYLKNLWKCKLSSEYFIGYKI